MTFGNFIEALNTNKRFYKPECARKLLGVSVKGGLDMSTYGSSTIYNWFKPDFGGDLYGLFFKKNEEDDYHDFDVEEFHKFVKSRLGKWDRIRSAFTKIDSTVAEYSDEDLLLYITYHFMRIVGIPLAAASFEEFRNGTRDSISQRIMDGLENQKEIMAGIAEYVKITPAIADGLNETNTKLES